MRLAEAGATVTRAEGLESGLAALAGRGAARTSSSSTARSAPRRPTASREAARAAGAPKSLVLFSPFERRAFGQTSLKGFDGWLVKPVRARSLYERLAAEFPAAPRAVPDASIAPGPRRRAAPSSPRTTTSTP